MPSREIRFSATYRLVGSGAEARARADDICYEQTVELPPSLPLPDAVRGRILGRVESFRKLSDAFEATISYAPESAAGELPQLLNVLFGNISLKPGIRLERFLLPPALLRRFRGPRFGVAGLRRHLGVSRRPLLCAALKPMGLSAEDLGDLAYQFALGGIDIIKDDHGLANQPSAAFEARVRACVRAVAQANYRSGFRSVYAPNITAPHAEVTERARFARRAGAGALLLAPGLAGFDAMRSVADDPRIELPILSHPAFQGSFVLSPTHGVSHYALFGQLVRLAGGDASIYPNYGGRFSFSRGECRSIVAGCRAPMGRLRQILPCPGGGMTLHRIPELRRFYGPDVILLIGGGLLTHGFSIVENCRLFRRLVGG
jgi:ribulose-bisphosphate carboxylase large chain